MVQVELIDEKQVLLVTENVKIRAKAVKYKKVPLTNVEGISYTDRVYKKKAKTKRVGRKSKETAIQGGWKPGTSRPI